MARLIDADAFLTHWNKEYRHRFPCDMYKTAIANFPTADAVPMVHGRWIRQQWGEEDCEHFFVCSECGERRCFENNYCSNCGAKMNPEVE